MYSLRLRQVTEEKGGLPWWYIAVICIYGIITIFIPVIIAILSLPSIPIIAIMASIAITAGIMFYRNMRSPTMLSATSLKLQYKYRAYRGQTIIPKFVVSLGFLKGLVPLEKTHPNGLIEFTNSRYGIMYRLFVPNRTGDNLVSFVQHVTKNIIDRIHIGQVLKVVEFQRYTNDTKVVEFQRYTNDTSINDQVAIAMNDETKTPEQREHLLSIYQQLESAVEVPVDRFIYAVVILGRFDNVDDAYAERDNLVPSLEDGFKLGGIGFNMLVLEDTMGDAYRRCMK